MAFAKRLRLRKLSGECSAAWPRISSESRDPETQSSPSLPLVQQQDPWPPCPPKPFAWSGRRHPRRVGGTLAFRRPSARHFRPRSCERP